MVRHYVSSHVHIEEDGCRRRYITIDVAVDGDIYEYGCDGEEKATAIAFVPCQPPRLPRERYMAMHEGRGVSLGLQLSNPALRALHPDESVGHETTCTGSAASNHDCVRSLEVSRSEVQGGVGGRNCMMCMGEINVPYIDHPR